MPTYQFLDKKTGEIQEHFMTISEAEEFSKNNPHLEWLCGSPMICDPWRVGRKKPDDGFRDVLKNIKKKSGKTSTINTW